MHDHVHRHIEAIAARSAPDSQRLARRLHARCWPGAGTDEHLPAAVEWVRRWAPAAAHAPAPLCRCAEGLCPICN